MTSSVQASVAVRCKLQKQVIISPSSLKTIEKPSLFVSSSLCFSLKNSSFSSLSLSSSSSLPSTPMATTSLTSFRPAPIHASASRKPDPNRRKQGSASWWAPLFGWSSDPDYINTSPQSQSQSQSQDPNAGPDPKPQAAAEAESESGSPRSRFPLGCFTEEKARQLRRKTLESSTFHDAMYHSAIASRLATDLSDRAK